MTFLMAFFGPSHSQPSLSYLLGKLVSVLLWASVGWITSSNWGLGKISLALFSYNYNVIELNISKKGSFLLGLNLRDNPENHLTDLAALLQTILP